MGFLNLAKIVLSFTRKKSVAKTVFNDDIVYHLYHNEKDIDLNVRTIKNLKQKFNSLIFKEKLEYSSGFRIINSKGFNSLGFQDPVDVVFCNRKHQIIETFKSFKPQKFSKIYDEASYIYVLANKTILRNGLNLGDLLKTIK